jgi:hypothetical protein
MTDSDSPWKEMLEQELALALAFFFPAIHAELDWDHDHEILEQELRALYPTGESGKRIADCLAKAVGAAGDARYLHGEVQGGVEPGFPRRMHVYNYRAEDRFGQPVISFAILIDDDPHWRPDRYESRLGGTTRTLEYSVAKILDWRGKEAELRTHANPVALFVLAQLASMRTKKDDEARAEAKLELILLLQERFDNEVERRQWYRYLDWLLALPKEYDLWMWDCVKELTKEKTMPYVTFADRYMREIGQAEGLVKAIESVLKFRFAASVPELMPRLVGIEDIDRLQHLHEIALTASLDELEAAIQAAVPSPK